MRQILRSSKINSIVELGPDESQDFPEGVISVTTDDGAVTNFHYSEEAFDDLIAQMTAHTWTMVEDTFDAKIHGGATDDDDDNDDSYGTGRIVDPEIEKLIIMCENGEI